MNLSHPLTLSKPGAPEYHLESYTRWCMRYGSNCTEAEEREAALQACNHARAIRMDTGDAAWDPIIRLWELTLST